MNSCFDSPSDLGLCESTIPQSRIPGSGKGSGESVFSMRDLNQKNDIKLFSRTLIGRRLSPPIGLIIPFDYYNRLRMSQVVMVVYRMC